MEFYVPLVHTRNMCYAFQNHYTVNAVVITWHCVITYINEITWYYKEKKLTVDSTM